jgi:hypothetical protein
LVDIFLAESGRLNLAGFSSAWAWFQPQRVHKAWRRRFKNIRLTGMYKVDLISLSADKSRWTCLVKVGSLFKVSSNRDGHECCETDLTLQMTSGSRIIASHGSNPAAPTDPRDTVIHSLLAALAETETELAKTREELEATQGALVNSQAHNERLETDLEHERKTVQSFPYEVSPSSNFFLTDIVLKLKVAFFRHDCEARRRKKANAPGDKPSQVGAGWSQE